MARQNSMLPKGAFPHLRPPHAEPNAHDPAAQGHSTHGGYQQPYDSHAHAAHGQDHAPHHPSNPRDIFNTLRTEQQQGLTSRLEAFSTPTASRFDPPRQDGYGYADQSAQGYQTYSGYGPGYDAYGRPLAGGHGYPADAAGGHDPRHYGGHHDPLQQDPRYAQGSGHGFGAQHDPYARDDAHAYDDPYRPEGAHAYGAQPVQQQGAEGEYYPDEYAEEAEPEPRRGPRAIVVVGALLAAIGLGGGLAYGYKSLTTGGSGKLPVLRADTAPSKAQPTDPGGKQVAHTDKKFLNRLTDDRARPVPVSIQPPPASERDAAASGEGAPRRVPTLVVNRDGSIAPTGSSQSAPPPMLAVPGMVVEGIAPRLPPPSLREVHQPAPQPAPPSAAEATRALPAPPRRVAAAQPTIAPEPPPAAVAPQLPRPDAEKRRPAVRQSARTDEPAPAPAASAPTTSGYVAVLSSRKSHMDALKTFADIQQKYSSVLQGRTPDVREANLGEKGIWYRVVVGPPGSREAANGVCGQLKSQGYSGCWIMAY